MKVKKVVKSTTNRGEFNRAYKEYLERKGKIHCSYCAYHQNENNDGKKWYGGFDGDNIRNPNWKLVSKKPKQWMKKPIRIVKTTGWYNKKTYVEIKFST